jgi:hypothetical protein
MARQPHHSLTFAAAVIVALTILPACDSGGGSSGPNISGNCGTISSIMTSKGTLTATGSWPSGNTQVILILDQGLPDAFVAPSSMMTMPGAGQAETATFTGLPSGTFTVNFNLSGCTENGGHMSGPSGEVTIP